MCDILLLNNIFDQYKQFLANLDLLYDSFPAIISYKIRLVVNGLY